MRRSDVLFVAFGVLAGCPQTFDAVSPPSDVDASTGADADNGDAASSLDGGSTLDVAVPDADPPVDANGEKPAIDAAGCFCDCDKDGYFEAGVCADGGAPFDCDDLDPRAFPDASFVTAQPTAETKGDWNCDTFVTRQYNVNIDCASYPFATSNCASIEGFTSDPGCGTTAVFVRCKATGLGYCATDTTETRTQGCK